MIFDCDDIHKARIEMAERYARMSPEEAEIDFQRSAEKARRAIEDIRHAKADAGGVAGRYRPPRRGSNEETRRALWT